MRRGFIFSGAIIAISLISILFVGFNLGIDFEGGTVIELENPAGAELADVRDALAELGIDNAKVQTRGEGFRIQTEQLDVAEEQAVVDAVAAVAGWFSISRIFGKVWFYLTLWMSAAVLLAVLGVC